MFPRSSICHNSKNLFISLMGRDNPNYTYQIYRRISSKFNQKPLGSYPFPPEAELLWKNRTQIPGGYFQHTISPFQLKFMYPVFQMTPARVWAKLSQSFWWVIWPFTMGWVGWKCIKKLDKVNRKRLNYF